MKTQCDFCNIEIEKNQSEINRSKKLGRKMFCSLSCSAKEQQKNLGLKNKENYNKNPKLCECCNTVIIYENRENKFCSKSCAAKINNTLFPKRMTCKKIDHSESIEQKKIKNCSQCGIELKSKGQKIFCGLLCFTKYFNQKRHEKIERGENVGIRQLKRYIILKRGNKCEECGWDKINPSTGNCPIEIEHIDGNSENNSLNNLKLLCPNCHSLTPTYKNLNKGNGRYSRRKRYAEGKSY